VECKIAKCVGSLKCGPEKWISSTGMTKFRLENAGPEEINKV